MQILNAIRASLAPFRCFPIHPQWLILRERDCLFVELSKIISGSILDIGCGNQEILRFLDKDISYLGLDFLKTLELGYNGKVNVFGDAQSLPFADLEFDTVLLMDVLEHLPDPELAVIESWRVLKHGGILIAQVPFLYPIHDAPHDFQRWTRHGLQRLCSINKFRIVAIKDSGNPIEAAAALTSIALARGVIDLVEKKIPTLILAPIFLMLIPFVNITGWLLAKVFPKSGVMPLSLRVVAVKE